MNALDEDGIMVTQNEVSFKCPYSGKRMVEPVTHNKCGHHYDKATVLKLLARSAQLKCPRPGCPNMVTKTSFKLNLALKRQIDADAKRTAKRKRH